ncbi:MAG: ribonuclease H family protein [Clostridiales bacterium]|nr:ribonuclease H family protein [Clostridiales bacterium]
MPKTKKNFYAVKAGRTAGIYKTWDECKKQVHGYPCAAFKGFATLKEAEDFMAGGSPAPNSPNPPAQAEAYVDGSYEHSLRAFSYGAVIFCDGREIHLSGKSSDPALVEMRNVAGEIEGAMAAMRWCVKNGIKSLEIVHDYEGIAKWCTGEWKAGKAGTKAYKAYYDSLRDNLQIKFVKVKGHSGNKGNDLADALAKQALGDGAEV